MKTVLLIDDDMLAAKVIEMTLLKNNPNLKILKAYNGEEGLKIIAEKSPDLIVLDLAMPKKSGFEVLEELQKNTKTKAHIMVLSNLSDESDKKRAIKLGGHIYFVKTETTIGKITKYISEQLDIAK